MGRWPGRAAAAQRRRRVGGAASLQAEVSGRGRRHSGRVAGRPAEGGASRRGPGAGRPQVLSETALVRGERADLTPAAEPPWARWAPGVAQREHRPGVRWAELDLG